MGGRASSPPPPPPIGPPQKADQLMSIMQNKLDYFLSKIESKRGYTSNFEVQGGRSIMRQAEIRVKSGDMSADDALSSALNDFFATLCGGNSKQRAVEGARRMLTSGLDSLFSCSAEEVKQQKVAGSIDWSPQSTWGNGSGRERSGFIVVFCNNAFVRVDFMCYVYCARGTFNKAGSLGASCYVADCSVLDPADISASEMDFLLTQALAQPPAPGTGIGTKMANDIALISKMKVLMIQSALCGRLLRQPDITFAKIEEVTKAMSQSLDECAKLFNQLPDTEVKESWEKQNRVTQQ